ncbi:TRAP transporter substrate-binding protein [Alteribacillus sp. YIM 98480]|uniref:TRAP transporter substrate-binding protein n=1 Tax=Alteribacillus sp. YIM 98480 TaxID=2606599 RepID=UPI00131A9BE8|nr:TRAP transporter substrate-binding protein [Alteribacillus sp. YIM 98480]
MKHFKWKSVISLAAFLFIATGCGDDSSEESNSSEEANGNDSTGEAVTLQVGHPAAQDTSYDIAARQFAEELEEKTDGQVTLDVFESNQLGDERSMLEQVQSGSLDMAITAVAPATNFVPELQVLEMPFIFRDREHAYAAYDGEAGDALTERLEEEGFKNLGFWEYGMKNISTVDREITSPDDLDGLQIRTQENDLTIDTYNALGADPTPVPFPEVYTSAQQGVIEAYEGPYMSYADINLYEQLKYFNEIPIVMGNSIFVMNKDLFDELDTEIQDIIMELSEKYESMEREISVEKNEEYKETTEEAGVTIIPEEEIDLESFREAVQPIYDEYTEFEDIIEMVENAE